jgi:hypothetical protein
MDDTPWLRHVLDFALEASASTQAPSLEATAGEKEPRASKVIEAILFSRTFMQTYNLVLLCVLAIFTAWHWGEEALLHRNKRRERKLLGIREISRNAKVGSSPSSAIDGKATSPDVAVQKQIDEMSPLLRDPQRTRKVSILWRPYHVTRSTLQHQPAPVPLIHKTLPTNAVTLFVLAWLALILFYNLYRIPLSFSFFSVFANRCGIIFIANLPLLYLLAAKNQPVKLLTGHSYEGLNIFHRRVGEVMCLEAFLHCAGMFAVWYGLLRNLGFTLVRFISNSVVLLGLFAFAAYELIYFTSLGSFRQRWYEVFLGLHIFLQVAGLMLLWFHHYTSRPYVGISLAIFILDRLVYRLWMKSSTHPATLSILEDDETLLLSANWEVDHMNNVLFPNKMKNGWKPNEHVFVSIPALSRKHGIQSHPFTIFSAAPTNSQNAEGKHAWFTLLIRAQARSGFTYQLRDYARQHSQIQVRLDGPYGSSHALDVFEASSTSIVVAGGSGIAVAYPLLYSLLQPRCSDPEVTLHGSGRKVKLLWVTHAPEHRLWIPEDKMKELEDWGLDVFMPPPTALAGRPDVKEVLRAWVGVETESTGVVVSGPDELTRDVRNICAGLMREGKDVHVQVEKFGW